MSWDKPKTEKAKEIDVEGAYATLGRHVHGFLSNWDSTVLLGTAESNYAVYKLVHTPEGDKLKLLADSSKLSVLLKKASKILVCEHQYENDTGWCKLCNVHKTMVE